MKLVSWLTSIKLENVFVKHYAPYHMFAVTENIYYLSLWSLIETSMIFYIKCQVGKGKWFSQIFTEFYKKLIGSPISCTKTVCLKSWSLIKRFSRYLIEKITSWHQMPKSEKGHNSAKFTGFNEKLTGSSTPLDTIFEPNITILA